MYETKLIDTSGGFYLIFMNLETLNQNKPKFICFVPSLYISIMFIMYMYQTPCQS